MTETRTLTTKKGKTIKTDLFDFDALEICRTLTDNSFAQDLVAKEDRYGLSHDQWVWVHVLAIESATQPDTAVPVYNVSEIVARLTAAKANGIKFPRVRIETQDQKPIVFSLAGDRAKVPGSVNVTDGGKYPNNAFYGRIELNGDWTPTNKTPIEVEATVLEFAQDPTKAAKLFGHKTGRCCFCGRDLETKESVTAGYGPVCADNYGLPWGHVDPGATKAQDEDFGLLAELQIVEGELSTELD